MNKPTVYLDITIPSYRFEEREELQTFVQITRQWWVEERHHFEVYVSEETVVELRRGNYPNKSKVLAAISGLPILPGMERIMKITQIYIDNYLMPRKLEGDARHLAFASLYHARLQLPVPEILTPLELFKETIP